jgi:hypothetical protein
LTNTSASWQFSRFRDLSVDDLYAIVRLREAVFIIEQNCPYPDADGRDPLAWHLLEEALAVERLDESAVLRALEDTTGMPVRVTPEASEPAVVPVSNVRPDTPAAIDDGRNPAEDDGKAADD